jgi:FMN phosphatase YigB (HAD superfamily)
MSESLRARRSSTGGVPLLPGDVLGRVLAKFSVGQLHAVSGVDRSFRDAARAVETSKPHVRLLELLRQNRSDEAGQDVDAMHAAFGSITARVLPAMHMAVDMERYRPCLPALVELLGVLVADGAAKGLVSDQKADAAATELLDGMYSAI